MNKTITTLILLLPALLSLQVTSMAQSVTGATIPKLNPAINSPEASALAKFGDIPVGLYTGIPSINVPIYTIKTKGLTIPIEMSYHSSGNKVNDVSTNVGLGWTLQAGGVITISVNGMSDLQGGWITPGYASETLNGLPTTYDYATFLTDPLYYFMRGGAIDSIDTQPDLFYLEMPGRSIKFFFDQDQHIYTIPHQRVKIVYTGRANGFVITDEQDNQYEYTEQETSFTDVTNEPSVETPSFYLKRIVTSKLDTITYTYDSKNYSFTNQPSETRYGKTTGWYSCAPPNNRVLSSTTSIYGKRLVGITSTSGERIAFNYTLSRLDLTGTEALTNVTVYNNATNDILSSFDLTYDYYPNNTHLRLVNVKQAGLSPYKFEYNSIALPERTSKAQDHWGYYNGASNTTLLPVDDTKGFYFGGNREPNPSFMQAGILNKITYPTGGYSKFTYEANEYMATEPVGTTKGYAVANGLGGALVNVPFTVVPNSTYFTVVYKTMEQSAEPANGVYPVGAEYDGNISSDVTITGPNNYYVNYRGHTLSTGILIADLPAGNYNIEIANSGTYADAYLRLYWTHPLNTSTTATINKLAGGLRVKSITNFSGPGVADSTIKIFEYKNKNDNYSSGVPGFKPVYVYMNYQDKKQGVKNLECYFNAQSISSLSPLGIIKGGNIAYTNVKVYTGNKTTSGYTNNTFSHFGGISGATGYPFAPVIPSDWIDGLPIETIDYVYHPATSNYSPVKKVENEYMTSYGRTSVLGLPNEHLVKGLKIAIWIPGVPTSFDPHLHPDARDAKFLYNEYYLYSSWSYPTKKTETVYDAIDTTKKVISIEQYFYDNPKHIELTREEISKSDGKNYVVQMRYPKDIDTGYLYNSSPVVEKRVIFKDGSSEKLVSGEITTYKNQAGSFPLAYYSLKKQPGVLSAAIPLYNGSSMDAAYEKRFDYTYDSNNDLITTTGDGMKHTAYVWGYRHKYPIAEINNSDRSEVYQQNFEEPELGLDFEANVVTDPAKSHTGKYSGRLVNTSSSELVSHSSKGLTISLTAPKKFSYSGWIYSTGPSAQIFLFMMKSGETAYFSYVDAVETQVINKWVYIKGEFMVPADVVLLKLRLDNNSAGTVWFDDLRIRPSDAEMSTYTYEPLVGMTSAIDNKGQTIYYEYDPFQRLKYIRNQDWDIIKSYDYNYKP